MPKYQFTRDMIALKDTCVHPKTKSAYVLSVKGGYDGNPVKHQVRELHILASAVLVSASSHADHTADAIALP